MEAHSVRLRGADHELAHELACLVGHAPVQVADTGLELLRRTRIGGDRVLVDAAVDDAGLDSDLRGTVGDVGGRNRAGLGA